MSRALRAHLLLVLVTFVWGATFVVIKNAVEHDASPLLFNFVRMLLAATTLGKMFPLMTTAAGTLTPAKVFIVGAGVAGLQAIATARRLGAVVSAYDVRDAVKEQVQSLGAKFVEMPLDTAAAEGKGGYAAAMDEAFYRRQRELMIRVVAENDVVITTAAIPGKKAQERAGAAAGTPAEGAAAASGTPSA